MVSRLRDSWLSATMRCSDAADRLAAAIERLAHGRIGVAGKEQEGELAVDRDRPALRVPSSISTLPSPASRSSSRRCRAALSARSAGVVSKMEARNVVTDAVVEAHLDARPRRGGAACRLRAGAARRGAAASRRVLRGSVPGRTLGGRAGWRQGRQQAEGGGEGGASEATR